MLTFDSYTYIITIKIKVKLEVEIISNRLKTK